MKKYYIAVFITMYDGIEFSQKVVVESDKVKVPTDNSLLLYAHQVYKEEEFDSFFELSDDGNYFEDHRGTALRFSSVQSIPREDGVILKDYLPTIIL